MSRWASKRRSGRPHRVAAEARRSAAPRSVASGSRPQARARRDQRRQADPRYPPTRPSRCRFLAAHIAASVRLSRWLPAWAMMYLCDIKFPTSPEMIHLPCVLLCPTAASCLVAGFWGAEWSTSAVGCRRVRGAPSRRGRWSSRRRCGYGLSVILSSAGGVPAVGTLWWHWPQWPWWFSEGSEHGRCEPSPGAQ